MKKGFNFTIGGQKYETTVKEIEPNVAEVVVNGTSFIVEFQKNESKKVKAARVAAPTAAPSATTVAKPAGAATVKSPLPGSIVKVMVKPGDSVKKGDTLLTMESMKMENIVASEYTGTVKNVLVAAGQNVMQDDKLVEIETVAEAAAPVAPKPVAAPQPKPAAPAPAPAPAPAAAPVGGNKINSPLPGSVISVVVKEGQAVKKGDTLLVLESMKMENPILSDCDGTITKIAVAAGQSVMQDDLLVVIG